MIQPTIDPFGPRRSNCACGKIMFDKKTAQTKANYLMKVIKSEKYLRVYQCELSGYWHLTKRKDEYA